MRDGSGRGCRVGDSQITPTERILTREGLQSSRVFRRRKKEKLGLRASVPPAKGGREIRHPTHPQAAGEGRKVKSLNYLDRLTHGAAEIASLAGAERFSEANNRLRRLRRLRLATLNCRWSLDSADS